MDMLLLEKVCLRTCNVHHIGKWMFELRCAQMLHNGLDIDTMTFYLFFLHLSN